MVNLTSSLDRIWYEKTFSWLIFFSSISYFIHVFLCFHRRYRFILKLSYLLPGKGHHVQRSIHETSRHRLSAVLCEHGVVHTVVGCDVLNRRRQEIIPELRFRASFEHYRTIRHFSPVFWRAFSYEATFPEVWREWIQTLLYRPAPECWSFHVSSPASVKIG